MTRLYVPTTVRGLAKLDQLGHLHVGDDVVVCEEETEEAEYDALMTAAECSAELAAELDPGERRRVVVVAEVGPGPARDTVDLDDVVAVHADAFDVAVSADPDDLEDLGWYATQEIPDLLR